MLLLNKPLGTIELLLWLESKYNTFFQKKIHWKILSAKYCPGLIVFTYQSQVQGARDLYWKLRVVTTPNLSPRVALKVVVMTTYITTSAWWRHQMETFSALLALCAGNSPVTGEFPSQRPVTRSFDVFFDLRLNKRLSKHSWGWWFETPSRSLWRLCNERKSWRHEDACFLAHILRFVAFYNGKSLANLCISFRVTL